MKFIRIKLPLEPVPQGRPKVAIKGSATWTYYSPKSVQAKNDIIALIKRHEPKKFEAYVPLRLTINFYRQRSKWVGKNEEMPVRKPDLDNFLKLVTDAMNGILFEDDAQITKIIASKRWADGGNWRTPGYIEIELVEDKLTRIEKAERDTFQRDKMKIAQWDKAEANKKKKHRRKKKVATVV